MSRRGPHPCSEPGCPELAPGGRARCDAHHLEERREMDRRRGPFRQRGYGREWEAVRAQVLAEESVCHICGREVDKRLSGDDPLGPTVDHVRRLADSGTNERANLRLAHRRCNSSRHGGRAHGAPQPEPAQRYRHGSTGLR